MGTVRVQAANYARTLPLLTCTLKPPQRGGALFYTPIFMIS
jgi:hypothetical protein